jgi:hypothetical protein
VVAEEAEQMVLVLLAVLVLVAEVLQEQVQTLLALEAQDFLVVMVVLLQLQ